MKIKYMLLIILLTSCLNSSLEKENYRLMQDWLYATQVKIQVPTSEIIERPPGAEVLIFQLDIKRKTHCVYYLVPFKSKPGKISVAENKSLGVCPETNQNENIVEIPHIKDLKIEFKNFHLKLSFERFGKNERMEFPLLNLNIGSIHQKFKNLKTKSLLPGLELYNAPKNYMGKLSDSFSLGQALRCHQVNSKCETVGEYRCDECRYGWYEVADYNCPQGSSKFCGQNHCGEKNEPACPRGYKLFENEDTGICQGDLLAIYNEDHILVCK